MTKTPRRKNHKWKKHDRQVTQEEWEEYIKNKAKPLMMKTSRPVNKLYENHKVISNREAAHLVRTARRNQTNTVVKNGVKPGFNAKTAGSEDEPDATGTDA